MAIDQHDPLPDEPMTTPAALGYPHGVYVTGDGHVQDGSQDGRLEHAAHERITLARAQELGLIRTPAPPPERRR